MSFRTPSRISLTIALFVLVPSSWAWAQPRKPGKADKADSSEALRIKQEADALMDQDKYAEALAGYERAYELSGDVALLYNQGRALEAMGEYPQALDKLEKFDHEATPALRAKVPGLRELMADLRGRIGTLVVSTNAPHARLLVREKAAGVIDGELRVRTRAGPATVEVVAEGFVPFKKNVDLVPGMIVSIDAILTPKKTDAIVVVRTHPKADVRLDGKALGRSPLEARLSPGSYTISAHADGHQDEHVPVTLALGDRREIDLELKKTPGLLSKWWFWTGIGVVVAGGIASYVVLTTERPADRGTFGPGSTTGP